MEYEGLKSDDLANVRALNRAWLDISRAGSRRLGELSPRRLDRIAAAPFLLFSLREQDLALWERLLAEDSQQELFRVNADLPGDLRARILEHSEGNPFYVEEILRTETPSAGLWRVVTRDTSVNGTDIPAGAMVMPLLPFAAASFVGRASRFFLVAGLLYWGGERFEKTLRRYVDVLGWVVVALIVVLYFVLRD